LKIYIAADMEGATGITSSDQTGPEGKDYVRAREWLTSDVNAAVEGAAEAGADDILVADSHGNMRNILIEKLDPRARLLTGGVLERELVQVEGIDESFDALLLVAFHARVGTEDGVMSHTWIGGIVSEMRLNGVEVGETCLAAATAGCFGVPVVMVAGDSAVCREAREGLTDVETAEVKKGLGRGLAICLPPTASAERIRHASHTALSRLSDFKPYHVDEPCELLVRFTRPILAAQAAKSLRTKVIDGDGVLIESPSVLDALKVAWRTAYVGAFDDRGLKTW